MFFFFLSQEWESLHRTIPVILDGLDFDFPSSHRDGFCVLGENLSPRCGICGTTKRHKVLFNADASRALSADKRSIGRGSLDRRCCSCSVSRERKTKSKEGENIRLKTCLYLYRQAIAGNGTREDGSGQSGSRGGEG